MLIDEARTPLIISGSADSEGEGELYSAALAMCRLLKEPLDFVLDRAERAVRLTEPGGARLSELAQALPAEWRSFEIAKVHLEFGLGEKAVALL